MSHRSTTRNAFVTTLASKTVTLMIVKQRSLDDKTIFSLIAVVLQSRYLCNLPR